MNCLGWMMGVRGFGRATLAIFGSAIVCGLAVGQDADRDDAAQAKQIAVEQFAVMRERVLAGEVESKDGDFPARFVDTPLIRYSDPARGYVSSAVWKLGDAGRPKAILVSELIPAIYGSPHIAYEFISLTAEPFVLRAPDMDWRPSTTLYEFQEVPKAPAPAGTAPQRLAQMRELARRFAGSEVVDGERADLRLLPQPIDRYRPNTEPKSDGAIFVFAFGTNPELMLLLECAGDQWRYAAGRMSGAETIVLTFDDNEVWRGRPLQKGADSPYTGSIARIKIPGYDAEGRAATGR